MRKYLTGALGFSCYLIFAATVAGIKKENQMYYFEERQYFTFFSALILAMTSFVCMLTSILCRKMEEFYPKLNFWFISSVGFFYLCIDEYFSVHEGMDRAILKALGMDPRLVNFDGWILGFLGVIGLVIFYKFRLQISEHKDFLYFFVAGALFFAGMVLADQFIHEAYPWGIIEEALKILGVTFLFAGYMSVLRDIHNHLLTGFSVR